MSLTENDTLGDYVLKIRSKNAGPFWVTVDVFCGDGPTFDELSRTLETERVAERFQVDVAVIRRFDIEALHVIKFSLPRPLIQGSRFDRDMHGAQYAELLAEMPR